MAYQVLARKWRPKTFADLVGQEHVVKALRNALDKGRLHHAYLLTGTRGVGKTTIARILAKSLNCEQGQHGEPCGVCASCTQIDAGRYVDLLEIDAASNTGIDNIREVLENAQYAPTVGKYKVYIIDEVHMLSKSAFNAMLKTLEEPPEYLKFVLATTDPQKVPVTVLSRCLQFNLRPMAPETVLDHLTRVLANENVPAEPQALRLLSRAARGSMRDALSLTDQAIAFGSGQLQEAGVRQMLGAVDRSYVFRLIDALAQGDGKTVVETADALRMNGLSAASTLEEMSAVLQRMAVYQAVPQMAQAVDASDPEAVETARLAAQMPADETQLLYSLCLHGRAELGLAPDEYAALTMVLLRLLAFKAPADPAEKKTLTRPETAPTPTPVAAAQPAAASLPVAPPPAPSLAPAPSAAAAPVAAAAPAVAQPPQPVPPVPTPVQSAAAPAPVAESVPPWEEDSSNEPPPWPDADDGSVPTTPAVPPVRMAEKVEQNLPPAQAEKAQAAPEFVAIPVREASEPSERLQPLPLSAPTPVSARYTPTEEGDVWHATVQQLVAAEAITALVRELALQSQLVARDGAHWLLRVERESLNQPTARERLRAALEAAGYATQISVEVGRVIDSPARRNAAAAAERQRLAEEIVMNDPYVQTLMREHGAKIVPGSIKPA